MYETALRTVDVPALYAWLQKPKQAGDAIVVAVLEEENGSRNTLFQLVAEECAGVVIDCGNNQVCQPVKQTAECFIECLDELIDQFNAAPAIEPDPDWALF